MISEELAFVEIQGQAVPYSHAVLIETPGGWHVELEDVPVDSCPFVEERCEISFGTWDGDQYSGAVAASYTDEGSAYLMLSGTGELERSGSEDVTGDTEDAEDTPAPT